MKLHKLIPSIKSRSSSPSSSPPSSPRFPEPATSASPKHASASPRSLLSPLNPFSERRKSFRIDKLASPLSKVGRFSEITPVSPKATSPQFKARPSSSFQAISESVVRELEVVFRQFDANGDGKISATELVAVLRSLGDHMSDEEASLMVKEVDADGDGFIDLQDFICLNTRSVNTTGEMADADELKSAFQIFDIDRNGLITPEELQRVLIRLGDKKCTMEECCKMIKGVDRNGDGFVDFEEFKSMMAAAY